ncbi:MAG TPA: energy transducer TonB, partial [Bacteroidia bacterium]
ILFINACTQNGKQSTTVTTKITKSDSSSSIVSTQNTEILSNTDTAVSTIAKKPIVTLPPLIQVETKRHEEEMDFNAEMEIKPSPDFDRVEHSTFEPDVNEEQAMYGKSEDDFSDFITKNLIYPKAAKDKGIKGMVWVTFYVEINGSVTIFKTEGDDPALVAEAVRLIKLTSGGWTPSKHKGKPQRMICKVPISFEDK